MDGKPAPGVLVIALDGAEASLLRRWMDSGDLPALRRLRDDGFHCPLESVDGTGDDGTWQIVTTGRALGRHGRYHYLIPQPDSYDTHFILKAGLAEPVFWRAIIEAGRQSAILDIPKTSLARLEGGLELRNWGSHGAHSPTTETWPPDAIETLLTDVGDPPHGPCADRFAPRTVADLTAFRDHVLEWIERYERLTLEVLARRPWDFVFMVYNATHCAGHALWHTIDPTHRLYDAEANAAVGEAPLKTIYKALDASIGRLVGRAGPQTRRVVFTPLGMGPNCTGNDHLAAFLQARDAGLDGSAGKLRDARQRAAYAADGLSRFAKTGSWRTPEWLAKWRQYRNRRAFQLPHNEISGAIRINLRGREPLGRVERGENYETVCRALTDDLLALTDPDHGQPVVARVLRPPLEHPGPNSDRLPDLLAVWRRDRPINGLVSPRWGRFDFRVPERRTGGHASGGLLLAAGPGIAHREGAAAGLVDLAPTIAALCGVTLPDVDGRAVIEIPNAAI